MKLVVIIPLLESENTYQLSILFSLDFLTSDVLKENLRKMI